MTLRLVVATQWGLWPLISLESWPMNAFRRVFSRLDFFECGSRNAARMKSWHLWNLGNLRWDFKMEVDGRCSRWWFQISLFSSRTLGKIFNLTHIFQMGWNHQPDFLWFLGSSHWFLDSVCQNARLGDQGRLRFLSWAFVKATLSSTSNGARKGASCVSKVPKPL